MNHDKDNEDEREIGCASTEVVSLTGWMAVAEEEEGGAALATLRLSTKPVYVSLFTDQGVPVAAHYLEQTEGWSGGYVHCLETDCPACRATVDRKRFMLLPVVDLTDGRVKILRVPAEKGPGKLLTELAKILGLESRAEIVTKITRQKNFQHLVEAHRTAPLSPDVAAAIKRFLEQHEMGAIDIAGVVARIPAEEMREHDRLAKRLSLEGQT